MFKEILIDESHFVLIAKSGGHQKISPSIMRPSNKLIDFELGLAVHALNKLSQLFLVGVAMDSLCKLVMFAHAGTLE